MIADLQKAEKWRNEDLQSLWSTQSTAYTRVHSHILPFKDEFKFNWITEGNEVVPGPYSQYLPQAISNIYNALSSESQPRLQPLLCFLLPSLIGGFRLWSRWSSYSACHISNRLRLTPYYGRFLSLLCLCFLSSPNFFGVCIVQSKATNCIWWKYPLLPSIWCPSWWLLIYAALEKIGFSNVCITISETTWPSAGNAPYASLENARAYNWNLWNHVVETGTPRKPDLRMDVFFLEMFNYNRKAIGVRAEFSIPLSKYASLFSPLWTEIILFLYRCRKYTSECFLVGMWFCTIWKHPIWFVLRIIWTIL